MNKLWAMCCCGVVVSLAIAFAVAELTTTAAGAQAADDAASPSAGPDEAAVGRSRKMVQMLDSIYKQTIVLITDKYVHDEDDFPAGGAAVILFKNISAGGSHEVRLIDATGEPYDDDNVARDDFEREGIKRLKAGADQYEQVIQRKDKPYLRTLTPVPVVMKKCIMCHSHYADAKQGEPIGAISYVVPIE